MWYRLNSDGSMHGYSGGQIIFDGVIGQYNKKPIHLFQAKKIIDHGPVPADEHEFANYLFGASVVEAMHTKRPGA